VTKHPSAQKRHRQSLKRNARNRAIRTQLRTFVRRVREAVAERNAAAAGEHLRTAARALDKAVSKGVLHRNTAARKISRMTTAVQKLSASA